MKKYALLALLLSTSSLIGGGNIAPESSVIAPITSTSSSSPSLPSTAMVEGTSSIEESTDLVYKERGTKLLWQDEAYTDEETGAFKREHSTQKAGNFAHAKQYCETLHYAGFSDWRLPSSDELTHVYEATASPHFVHFRDNDFWTSTPTTRDKYYVVFPTDAMRYARSPRQSNFIRCVREIIED